MTTTEKPRAATYAQVVHIPVENLYDNPWQPRTAINPDELQDLADSIYKQGLLQPPVARPYELKKRLYNDERGRVFQLAFGHRRVAAIRKLIDAGLWEGGVPCSVQDISDQDMALMAISENVQRQDLTPIECIKSYQRMLEEIPGLKRTQLADRLGVHRSTLANNLRLLKLPELVLERVESGEMPTHSAREFLCLQADDHVHADVMEKVIRTISDSGGATGAPDWRYANVRESIRYKVRNDEANWRPMEDDADDKERFTQYNDGGKRSPSFDVDDFTAAFENMVHSIPALNGKARRWTCNVKEWRKRQTAGTRSANKGAAENPTSERAKAKKTATETAFDNDPILVELRKAFPGKRPTKLTTDEREAMGTRATLSAGYQSSSTYNHLNDSSLPPGFPDIEECRTKCTWGAKYLREHSGIDPVLVCGNPEAFNKKKELGIEVWKTELVERLESADKADKIRIDELSELFSEDSSEMPVTITKALLRALHGEIEPFQPHPNSREFRYHPAAITHVFKTILNVELDPNRNSWEPREYDTAEVITKLDEMNYNDVADLAAALIVWTERWSAQG